MQTWMQGVAIERGGPDGVSDMIAKTAPGPD